MGVKDGFERKVGTVEAEDCFKDMEKAHMKDNGRST